MSWRTEAVFVAVLVFTSLGVALTGSAFVGPAHAEDTERGVSVGAPGMSLDPAPLTAAAAASSPADVSGMWDEVREAETTVSGAIRAGPIMHMTYPAEEEPDGNRWLPHHGLWALGLYLVGWYYWYPGGAPLLGATLVGLAILLLFDDWFSHALGIKTPGDMAFDWLMRHRSFRRMYIRLWWIIYR